MPHPPLRAVILDNDETTGSYGILFSILAILQQIPSVNIEYTSIILQKLAQWMVTRNVFRPGLKNLLQTCIGLKNQNRIDAIVMYTNQLEQSLPEELLYKDNISHILWSPPRCIAYMMNYLVDDTVFDCMLSRPPNADNTKWIMKSFSRILDLYPLRPKDIRQMVFIDDMAFPNFIDAKDIPPHLRDVTAWQSVEPYSRRLTEKEFVDCITYCFGSRDPADGFTSAVWDVYQSYIPEKSSIANASPFLILGDLLQKKFGYVNKHTPPGLNHRTVRLQNGRTINIAVSQIDGGTSEGEYTNSDTN